MKKLAIVWMICSALLISPVLVHAANSSIVGTVVNKDGTGQKKVQVHFKGPKDYALRTNSRGTFSHKRMQDGTYTVTVKRGSRVQRFKVTVKKSRVRPNKLVVNW